ncbi:PREDICTED: inositol-tetrakisphosphate 1-kinase 2-like isoform X1 [Populus euphratica]|uniref:Inositol-tetrakisphosphate 1-kinase 2-like isoform X1 n=2 Tax=Populus euphratica TaxID=75702 RepID=A0AAJ6X1N0_POPEU|nr:PREDICTED: inositol-tetrakisphosphate 1-kinase 2-like isoform X1 [Populus euphratica]
MCVATTNLYPARNTHCTDTQRHPSLCILTVINREKRKTKNTRRYSKRNIEIIQRVLRAMRIHGEMPPEKEEEEKVRSLSLSIQQPQKLVVVGYALTSKKKKSFLQPKLEVLARNKGILFVAIDLNRPLLDQGPFDVVLHKLLGKDWCGAIEDYRKKNPEVAVLDPPDAIEQLLNRQSMLNDVTNLNLSDCYGKVCVPRQMVINNDPSSIPHEVTSAGLKLPLVVKPLVVDGTAKSHELFLAYDQFSLSELEPPLVLQEFVNHGGVLFKIYIVGEAIKVVRRFSLPNVTKQELSKVEGVFRFPRVSSAAASADDADLDPSVAELPPLPLLEKLARELRRRLGLRLFNVDMIREHGTKDVFYVIDINYFPGYGKMPDYEHIFTDFLLTLMESKYKNRPAHNNG